MDFVRALVYMYIINDLLSSLSCIRRNWGCKDIRTARENVYQAMRKEEPEGFMYHFMHCVTEVDAGVFLDTGSLASKP